MISRRILVIASFLIVAAASAQDKGPEGDHHVGYSPDGNSSEIGVAFVGAAAITRDGTPRYVEGRQDNQVWRLEAEINRIHRIWGASDDQDIQANAEIRRDALQFGRSLASIDDRELGLGGLIVKGEYVCYAFVIAAATSASKADQLSSSRQAEGYCEDAGVHLRHAREAGTSNQNAIAVTNWASTSFEQPRISYLLAMSKCLQFVSSGNEQKLWESIKIINSDIPGYYLSLYPPSRDFVLKQCSKK